MYCSNCGTEITEQSKFCPSCGKSLNDTVTETHVDEKQRVEVICPHCGSNQVSLTPPLQPMLFVLYFLVFGFLALFINKLNWVFAILSIGSLIIAILFFLVERVSKTQNYWTVHCETCNKNFNIDIPNGDTIITNLKVKDNNKSNSGTLPWE
jgi:hypothetical protein